MGLLSVFKEHPIAAGGAVIVGGLLLYMMLAGGNSGSSPSTYTATSDPNSVAAATALQQSQLQAASVSTQTNAALAANSNNNAAAIQLATINGQTSTNNNTIAAGVALANINASQQAAALHDTLTAAVTTNAQNQSTAQLGIQANAAIQNETILANSLITQSNNQTRAEIAIVNAQAGVAQGQIAANQAIQTQSWFSKIF